MPSAISAWHLGRRNFTAVWSSHGILQTYLCKFLAASYRGSVDALSSDKACSREIQTLPCAPPSLSPLEVRPRQWSKAESIRRLCGLTHAASACGRASGVQPAGSKPHGAEMGPQPPSGGVRSMGRERGEASLPHRILNKRITRASLPSELLNVIEEGHERFDDINCSTALTRLARLWSAKALSSDLQEPLDRAVGLLTRHVAKHHAAMEPQALANSIYSLAKLRRADRHLLGKLATSLASSAPRFNPQQVANVLLAHSKARVMSPLAVAALADQVALQAGDMTPQQLSNSASSFAVLQQDVPGAMEAIAEQVVKRAGTFTPQNLANVAWAFARTESEVLELFEAIAAQVEVRIGELNLYDVKQLMQGYALRGYQAPGMLSALIGKAAAWHEELAIDQALIALNTIAQVAPLTSPSACKKMFEVVTNGMAELTAPELVSLALSMASLPDTFARKDISTLMTHVVARVADLDPHLMSDLFQVELAFNTHEDNAVLLAAPMYSIAQRHWLSRQRAESCPLKADVHKALTSLGIDAETGWRTDDGLVPVDIIVFISNRRQVALQVDGPACFTCSRPHEPLAKTRLFRLMLEHRCPGFVSVPFFEWEPLKSVQHRMSYLSEKLQPHFT